MSWKMEKTTEEIIVVNEYFEELENALGTYRVINVCGEGGIGKTTFLRSLLEIKKGNKIIVNEEHNICTTLEDYEAIYYTEVSSCMTEMEIYQHIADAVNNDIKMLKFSLVYQWYQKEREKGFRREKAKDEEIASKINDLIGNIAEAATSFYNSEDIPNRSGTVLEKLFSSLFNVENISLLLNGGFSLYGVLRLISSKAKEAKQDKILSKFLENVANTNSEYGYRKALKELFVEEWNEAIAKKRREKEKKDKEKEKKNKGYIVIIDNYMQKYSSELQHDISWLEKLGAVDGVCWIVGSRRKIELNSQSVNACEISLNGFNEAQADKYIKSNIFVKIDEEGEKEQTGEDRQQKEDEIRKKIKEICRVSAETELYLPYRLQLVKDYMLRMAKERKVVTVEDLVAYKSDPEFVSYYFFSEMSEMVVAAVQLLSCLASWDEYKLRVLKEKFNYYYLETEFLLKKSASIEREADGTLKLHEAIRDAVYASPDNYVKLDVQAYLSDKLMEEIQRKNARVAMIHDYFELSLAYLVYLKNNDKDIYNKQKENFLANLKTIYKSYSNERVLSVEFAQEYGDALKQLYEDIEENNEEWPVEYIIRKLQHANLYTSLYMAKQAKILEKKCIEKAEAGKGLEYEKVRLKAYNWYSFDCSKAWDYNEAYEKGWLGLQKADELLGNFCEQLEQSGPQNEELVKAVNQIREVYAGRKNVVAQGRFFIEDNDGVSWQDLRKAFEILAKNAKNSTVANIIDLISEYYSKGQKGEKKEDKGEKKEYYHEAQYDKLRGNFPWYILHSNCERREEFDAVQYGINTFLIRTARRGILDKTASYIKSLNNIGAYLFKTGHFEQALSVLEEAISLRWANDRLFQIRKDSPEYERMKEITGEEDVKKRAGAREQGQMAEESIIERMREHCCFLYQTIFFSESSWSVPGSALESYSYAGDVCLSRGWYREAMERFGMVLLNSYVRKNIFKSETLDAYCRCGVALYAQGLEDMAKRFLEDTVKISSDKRIECPIQKQDIYRTVRDKMNAGEEIEAIIRGLDSEIRTA